MMRLLVPHYELKDGVITPDGTKPPKEIYEEGQLWPARGKSGKERVWPRVLMQFVQVDPRDESAILAFANQFGILGCWLWDPLAGAASPPEKGLLESLQRRSDIMREQRHRELLRQPLLEPGRNDGEVEKACLREPRVFTLSLWHSESLERWRSSWAGFALILTAMRGLAGHLAQQQQHSNPRLRQRASTLGRVPFDLVNAALKTALPHWVPPQLKDWATSSWGEEFPPEQRFRIALQFVENVSVETWAAARFAMRPTDNLLGFQWEAYPPCLLNLLYLLMFSLFVTSPPDMCRFPTCGALAFGDSPWCCSEHHNLYRQHKHRAQKAFGLTDEEVDQMERVAVANRIPFAEAAEQVKESRGD